ncbi:MAG: CehA/McbA family metallohydrolase [Polyangiaceae bacterium]
MRRSVACLMLLAGAACPARSDVTPLIRVDPRAAGRLDWLAHADEASAPRAAPARVHVMKEGEQLGGPNAIGRPGDTLLENDEVVFVIDQLGSSAGFAESGGNIVDAADARTRKDELGQAFTFFGTFPRQGVYDTLSSGTSGDGSAWVEARGKELYEPKLAVSTRYTLHPPDRALLLETTIENTGDAAVLLPSLGDAIQWGGAQKTAPGKPAGFKGPSSGPYVGGVGRFASYAVTATDGAIDGISGGSWTDTAQRKGVTIAPGEKVAYARIFLVGERPDLSSLVGELAMAAGSQVGEVEVRVPSASEGVPTGFSLALVAEGSEEKLSLAPPFHARLPVGRYRLEGPGKATPSGLVDVRPDAVAHFDLTIDPPATAELHCVSVGGAAMPCKVTFEGIGPTPTPSFGLPHAAGPAHNQVTTADGLVTVSMVPGKYHVTASRGPEYALATVDLDLDRHLVHSLALARVVDTAGYLACDFHQHTMLGADAPVSTVDRAIANVAEGVEIAVASEHNVVADLEPIVKSLHLEREVVSISGDELTSDASRHPWGHANVFPLVPDASKPRGGAPPVRDRLAHEVFEELRRAGGEVVVQVNHPRSGSNGYFDLLGFQAATGVGTQPGYDATFDALEVWNGRNVEARGKVRDDFFALLRTGHPVTATATTDTHGIVGQEAGYPRTYVRVGDDMHLDAWNEGRTADLVRAIKSVRDVVLTNGPMLRVTAGGVSIGGVVRGRAATVKVHVESAPWVVVDEVSLVRASAPDKPDTKRIVAKPNESGALVADVSFDVRATADDAFVIVASGTRPMSPVLAGDDREIVPWAMTGAIWIDADRDGRALGR